MSRSKVVAFVGKAGFRYYVDDNTIELQYGKQNLEINKSNVYLLPFTSGQSFADTKYHKKLHWYRTLKRYVNRFLNY